MTMVVAVTFITLHKLNDQNAGKLNVKENEFLWYFRVSFWYIFLECLKLVKSKEIPNKACA